MSYRASAQLAEMFAVRHADHGSDASTAKRDAKTTYTGAPAPMAVPAILASTEASAGSDHQSFEPGNGRAQSVAPVARVIVPKAGRVRHTMMSAWAFARAGGTPALSEAGQLGGSQLGMRVIHDLDPAGAIGLTARVIAPLGQATGKELAVGITIKPAAALPIRIIAEQRLAADRSGRTDFELLAAAGVYDRPLGHKLKLNAYAQAGLVGIDRRDAFADGSIEVERTVTRNEKLRFAVGAGTWGAAQPGVARLDVGPQVVARAQIGVATIKLAASYRLRIAGEAAPNSGPALNIAADF
jgi:hypothetical protein